MLSHSWFSDHLPATRGQCELRNMSNISRSVRRSNTVLHVLRWPRMSTTICSEHCRLQGLVQCVSERSHVTPKYVHININVPFPVWLIALHCLCVQLAAENLMINIYIYIGWQGVGEGGVVMSYFLIDGTGCTLWTTGLFHLTKASCVILICPRCARGWKPRHGPKQEGWVACLLTERGRNKEHSCFINSS